MIFHLMTYGRSPRWLRAFQMVALLLLLALVVRSAEPLTGRWVMTADFFGTPRFLRLDLQEQSGDMTGTYNGIKLTGKHLELSGKGESGNTAKLAGTPNDPPLSGSVPPTAPAEPLPVISSSNAVPANRVVRGAPRRHEFTPTVFYRQY